MQIIRAVADWPDGAHGSVMALGNFDGVHIGHRAVIKAAANLARETGRPLSVMTFEPHPRRFFKPDLPTLRITPFSEKARQLREAGVDYLYVAHFNRAFSEITAEAFVSDLLVGQLKVNHVVTGYNFAFGHQRGGDVTFLEYMASKGVIAYSCVPQVLVSDGEGGYSSTAIRHALKEGNVKLVEQLLGRAYSMRGLIIGGDQRGRQIGFPTANIRPSPVFLPRFGVYAVTLKLEDGRTWSGVANFGVRPTLDGEKCLLEVHALGLDEAIYGARSEVVFHEFIRPEQKFDGLDALKTQIAKDVAHAKTYFETRGVEQV